MKFAQGALTRLMQEIARLPGVLQSIGKHGQTLHLKLCCVSSGCASKALWPAHFSGSLKIQRMRAGSDQRELWKELFASPCRSLKGTLCKQGLSMRHLRKAEVGESPPCGGNGFGWGQMSHALAWLYYVTELEPTRPARKPVMKPEQYKNCPTWLVGSSLCSSGTQGPRLDRVRGTRASRSEERLLQHGQIREDWSRHL